MRSSSGISVWAAAALAASGWAQEDLVIRGGVELVDVPVTFRDKRGALVRSVARSAVHVFEDGVEQTIRNFTRSTDQPVTLGVLVDVSGSVADRIPDERRAAREFFRQVLRPGDQAFLISFAAKVLLLRQPTGMLEELDAGLNRLAPGETAPGAGAFTGTLLYDAIFAAARLLEPMPGRKAIILISDGDDWGSQATSSLVLEAAERAGAIVYCIFVPPPALFLAGNGEEILKRLADRTGGRFYQLGGGNLSRIFAEIGDELRTQYSLSYASSNPARDGAYRRIEIRTDDKDLKVQTRRGYYARRE